MKEATQTTEERILTAARRVFMERGYDGTTSRSLAEAAGLNVAMTNYYFRSKEKLFKLVFKDLYQKFFEKLVELVDRDISLREKVLLMIEAEFELVVKEPGLPMFVLYELQHNFHLFDDLLPPALLSDSLFFSQVEEAVASGQMPPINPIQIPLLILANVQHPYMARPFVTKVLQQNQETLAPFMAQHQQTVKDMLMGYLFKAT